MRNKENRLVITFHSTTEAMEAEKRLKELGVPGRLIPIPRRRMWSGMERTGEGTGECDTIGRTDAAVI